jgi:hypothetical protein
VRRDQCDALVEEMHGIWRGSRTLPTMDAWRSTLEMLDAALAAETLARLAGRSPTAPSIAEFRSTYRVVEEAKVWRPQARKRCSECEGTGWVEGPAQRYEPSRLMVAMVDSARRQALADGEPWTEPVHETTSVVPCLHCAAGKRAEQALAGK